VGAALAATSVAIPVWAQQFLPSSGRSVSTTASAGAADVANEAIPAATAADPNTPDPIFGMAMSRGARYLMRNGLDYIDYQEYDRALKFLREAERRQRELTSAEVRTLKQGIERAQRGLREAVGSETPYALSKRTRRPGGFSVASRSATSTRAKADPQTITASATAPALPEDEPDALTEPQGEPIQLAAASSTGTSAQGDRRRGGERAPASASQATAPIELTETATAELAAAAVMAASPEPAPVAAPAQPTADADVEAAAAQNDLVSPLPALDAEPEPAPVSVGEEPAPITVSAVDPVAAPAAIPDASTDFGVAAGAEADADTATETASLPPLDDAPASLPLEQPAEVEASAAEEVAFAPADESDSIASTAEADSEELPTLPSDLGGDIEPAAEAPPVGAALEPQPGEALAGDTEEALPALPETGAAGAVATEPAVEVTPGPADLPEPAAEPEVAGRAEALPPLPAEAEALPAEPETGSVAEELPTLPPSSAELPDVSNPDAVLEPSPAPAAVEVEQAPAAIEPAAPAPGSSLNPTDISAQTSRLSPELRQRVEQIARRQEEDLIRRGQQPQVPPNPTPVNELESNRDVMVGGDMRTITQADISRAPSPAEARPIRAIPVPEDFVPLGPRNWTPQRKYWAAAATCHLPLYFQDAALERYGHSVESFFGPKGRYATYHIDDPTQSTQRNQIAQPFFSAGLFAFQILALPYNMIVDPPWEAEYDLGYFRPGDTVPTDVYYLPWHGVGPPLRGKNY
jgi:hypothetical protein